jgi:hypothetical protein
MLISDEERATSESLLSYSPFSRVSITNTVPKLLDAAEQAHGDEISTDPVSLRLRGSSAYSRLADKLKVRKLGWRPVVVNLNRSLHPHSHVT